MSKINELETPIQIFSVSYPEGVGRKLQEYVRKHHGFPDIAAGLFFYSDTKERLKFEAAQFFPRIEGMVTMELDDIIGQWKAMIPQQLVRSYILTRYIIENGGYFKELGQISYREFGGYIGFVSYDSNQIDPDILWEVFKTQMYPRLVQLLDKQEENKEAK